MDRYVRWLLYIPCLWLIYHLCSEGYTLVSTTHGQGGAFTLMAQAGLLSEFKIYRNTIYGIYAVLLMMIGLFTKISTQQSETKNQLPPTIVQRTMPFQVNDIITAIIITTFAYAIAAIILDAVFLLK